MANFERKIRRNLARKEYEASKPKFDRELHLKGAEQDRPALNFRGIWDEHNYRVGVKEPNLRKKILQDRIKYALKHNAKIAG